ncbi:hypothetical protein EFP19_11745 [Burkholderia glumae]|nr:hypothetical protein EFP19_11745 [Burkholderia glumae]
MVDDLHAEQRRQSTRAVFLKGMPSHPGDVLAAHQAVQGRVDDKRIAAARLDTLRRGAGNAKGDAGPGYDAPKMVRAILDADHARRLLPGDLDRATRAVETGKPIPRDVLVRINGGAK